MKLSHLVLFALAVLAILEVSIATTVKVPRRTKAIPCGSATCYIATDKCCNAVSGPVCYDPSKFDCPSNSNGQSYLCSKYYKVCGTLCYNPSTNICFGGKLCAVNQKLCGNQCYDTASYNCYDGFLCPINSRRCGNLSGCYDPLLYKCVNGQLAQLSAAEKAAKPCGAGTCGVSTQCCGNSNSFACYDRSQNNCVDPTFTTVILTDQYVCPKGYVTCPLRNASRPSCIKTSKYFCLNEAPGASICKKGYIQPYGVIDTTACTSTCNANDPDVKC